MTYEKRKEWLQSLKEGDSVCVYYRGWGSPYYDVFTIKRMTATQLVCVNTSFGSERELKFRKENGYIVGDGYDQIEPITTRVMEVNKLHKLKYWFSSLKFGGLKLECLEAMKAAYDSFDNPFMEGK